MPRPTSIVHVWRESFDAFNAHAPAILLFGVIGFAGASILCIALSTALGLHFYSYASGPFATKTGMSAINATPSGMFDGHAVNVHTLLLVQAALGLLAMSFARGAITRIALECDCDDPAQLHDDCRTALARLPALLIGSLIYGGLIMLGTIGINMLLCELSLDLDIAGARAGSLIAMRNLILLRIANALMPDPGSPFLEFFPYWRSITFERALTVGVSSFWPVVVGSITLMVLTDAMLRFRTVTAIQSTGIERAHKSTPFVWLIESVRLGLRHFGQIIVHIWLLRLATVGFTVSFLILPVALVETIAMRQMMTLIHASSTLPSTVPFISMSVAFVSAILSTFGAVYDARLFVVLSRAPG